MNPDVETTPFTFRLERVRSLRERAEDEAREALGHQMAHRVRGEALLRQATDVVTAARDSGRDAALRGASGADLLAAQAWLERADRGRPEASRDRGRAASQGAGHRGPRPRGDRPARAPPPRRPRGRDGAPRASGARRGRTHRPPEGNLGLVSVQDVVSRVEQLQQLFGAAATPGGNGGADFASQLISASASAGSTAATGTTGTAASGATASLL